MTITPTRLMKRSRKTFLKIYHATASSRLVAFVSNEVVGTIVLRRSDIDDEPELGGLYVDESFRAHGIGTELVKAGMNLAREQGYKSLTATTVKAAGILERLGWKFIETVQYPDGEVSLYRCKL